MTTNNEHRLIELKNNIQISYVDSVTEYSNCLLFIHGLANYSGVWKWNTRGLHEKFRCIALDLPGNGYSSRGDYPFTIQFYAETIIEFIEAVKLKKVTLVGHSMGGQIALYIAIHAPQYLYNLVLSAPAGFEYYTPSDATLFKSAISFGNFLAMDETHIVQSINASFYAHKTIANSIIDDLNKIIKTNDRTQYRRMLDCSISSMLDDQIFHQLKQIELETLVFFGENDQLIPNRFLHPMSTKELAEKGTKEMKNARLITYKETGHFVHIEKANEVNHEIIHFLNA